MRALRLPNSRSARRTRYAALLAALATLALLISLTAAVPTAHAQGEGDGLDPEAAERMADEMGGDGSGDGSGGDGSGDEGSGDGGSVPNTDSMEPGTRDAVEDSSRGDPAAQESLRPEEEDTPATDPSGEPLPEEAQDAVEEDSRGDPAAQDSVAEDRSQPNNDDSGGESGSNEESGSGSDEGGESNRECSLSPKSSYAFQILSPNDVEHDRSYMVCGVGNYYLSYVDFSNWMNQLNPVPDPQQWTYNGFNGLASMAMEVNAQMMAMTIDLLNFALDLNLVETLRGTVDTVVGALGEGFYMKLYTAAGAVALVYTMWLIAKGRMQEAGFAVIKASFVMFIGLWLTGGQAAGLATTVNNYQEALTNVAFTALTGINEGDQSAQALGCESPKQCISANIWERYVYDPWANLQISDDDQVAEKERDRILKISNPEDREAELKDLGNENDEVKSVVDMVYATGHFLKAALQFVVSFFFSLLVFTLVFCLIAAEIMMVALIMTAPIWMVLAIFPAGMLFERFIFYTLAEAAQIFGYKILIAIHLLLMNAIMSNFGTATGYLLACGLTVAAFFKRKTLYKLLAPTGLARTLEARYKRGRQIRADAAAARGGGMFAGGSGGGSAAAAGAGAATGVPASGARPVRQSFAEARQQMEANSYTPEGLRSGAATLGAAGAGAAFRGAKAAPGSVRDDTEARAEEAMRLNDLAQRRADDPDSLSDSERRELERAEAMTEAGNDPLARASIANRGFVKEARERRRHRKENSGIGTYAALAGPRKDGESERDYLGRQKEARKKANEARGNLSEMARNRQGFNVGGYPKSASCTSCGKPFQAMSAADTVCSVCRNHGPNHGVKTNNCARCGKILADPNQTLCSSCRGDNGPGGGGGPGGPGTGSGAGRPRFSSSADGTVRDSGQRAESPVEYAQNFGPYDDLGDASATAGRPRDTDTPFESRSSDTATDYAGSASNDTPLAEERFVGFGHPDVADRATESGATFADYGADGSRESAADHTSGSGESFSEGSSEDSEARRPRGFEAGTPDTGAPDSDAPDSDDSSTEASAEASQAEDGSETTRPSKVQRFSAAGHTVLDVAGYIPAAGAVPDLANAGWYYAEGNRKDAAISAGAAIPVAGDSGKAIADANKAQKAAKIHARADRIERGIDKTREPSSVRPERFSRQEGSGLWLPRGSSSSGSTSSGSTVDQVGAASGDPVAADSGRGSVSGSSSGSSTARAASAQRPQVQRSEQGQSTVSKESSPTESSPEKSPSKESSVRPASQQTANKLPTQKPSEPKPSEPKPSEPKPSEPKPSEPKPAGDKAWPEPPIQEESRKSTERRASTRGMDLDPGRSFSEILPESLRPERFTSEGGGGLWLPNNSSRSYENSSGGSSGSSVQRPAADTSRGARDNSSRQSQRRTNEGSGSSNGRDNS